MLFSVQVDVQLVRGSPIPPDPPSNALPTLGFDGVSEVKVGKSIRFTIDATDEAAARAEVDDLCHRFLTNPVIEESTVTMAALTGSRS